MKSILLFIAFLGYFSAVAQGWSKRSANEWYNKNAPLIGCNFIPSTAINQLEMWQAETFDTSTISRELSWAAGIGMNTIRVYLHDLAYQQDPEGFLQRIDIFLGICQRYAIKPVFVLFDSCWDPLPKTGKQRTPRTSIHNSGWVQSPGAAALKDASQYGRLEQYVKAVINRFSKDERLLAWDVWNEPDFTNEDSYAATELENKTGYVLPLLTRVFRWVREAQPAQPVTSGVWWGNWSHTDSLRAIEKLQIENSDIISFHCYQPGAELKKKIKWLQQFGKPLLCTEYLARTAGSTFETCLPVLKKYHVAAYNWGLVDGKTQTKYPWDSWQKEYSGEPVLWHHDIFRKDGSAFNTAELDWIRQFTGY